MVLNNSSNTEPEIVDLTPDQESDSLDDIDKQNEQSNAPMKENRKKDS